MEVFQMKKRLLSLILAAMLTAGFVSCAQNPEETKDNAEAQTNQGDVASEEAEPEVNYVDTLGDRNFDGAEFIILASDTGGIFSIIPEELNGSAINDAIVMRDKSIEDKYNIKVVYAEYPDDPSTATTIINSVKAGDAIADAYNDALSGGSSYMGATYQQGALYNMLDIPYLSLDQSWWSSLIYDSLLIKNKLFFTSGDMAPTSYTAPSCTFYNLQVGVDHGIAENDIYSLVYEGKWTLDEMIRVKASVPNDLNGDGVMKPADDAYGVGSATVTLTSTQIVVGSGLKLSEIDSEGNVIINLNTEKNINILNKLKECYNEVKPGDDWGPLLGDAFKSDRELFAIHFVETANSFRDMESDFAILPMPKYDESQDYMSYINPHTHSFVAVPLIQNDIEKTGFILEVMEYMSVEQIRPAVYDITLKGKCARNPDSQAMLDIVFNATYTDINAICDIGGSATLINSVLFGDKELSSGYSKVEKVITKSLEKMMNSIYGEE